nr:uncharacterized protein LOC109409272 [Aedes albopictus]
MANLLPLPKVASKGSSDTYPRPESYHTMSYIGRSGSSVNKSSQISKESARLALQLRQIHEERAIQQRAIEIERRAFALERKILEEKYKLLEQQIRMKSAVRKRTNAGESSADGIPLPATAHTASDTTMHREPQFEKLTMQPKEIESSPNRLQVLGTQQLISSAFPKADLRKQHLIADSSERCDETICISRPPYGTPSSSEFNSEDTAGRLQELYHETGQHQTQMKDQTITNNLRRLNNINSQQRILIPMPTLQLHQYEETYKTLTIVCALKELTVRERERNEYGPTLIEILLFRMPLYLDTGQKLGKTRSAQNWINNVEAILTLFCAKKIDLLVAVRHDLGSSLLSFVFDEGQNAMINSLVSNVPFPNLAKLPILRGFFAYTSAKQFCDQQELQTMTSTILTAEYASKGCITKHLSNASSSAIPTALEQDKSSSSSKLSRNTNHFLLVSCWDFGVRSHDVVNNILRQKYYHDAPFLDFPFYYSVHTVSAGLDNLVELSDLNEYAESFVGSPDAGVVMATSERKDLRSYLPSIGQHLTQREFTLKLQIHAIRCSPNVKRNMISWTEKKVAFKCHRSKENNIELICTDNAVSFNNVYNTFDTGGSDWYGNDLGGQASSRDSQLVCATLNQGVCSHVPRRQMEHNAILKSLKKRNKDENYGLITFYKAAKAKFMHQPPLLRGIELEKLSPSSEKVEPSNETWDSGDRRDNSASERYCEEYDVLELVSEFSAKTIRVKGLFGINQAQSPKLVDRQSP